MRKPHTQIGQKGKGRGRVKRKRKYRPRRVPPMQTPGLPLEVGEFPKAPPEIANFLPNTAAFERTQSGANDALSQAGAQYRISTGLIDPQLQMLQERLQTDMGNARGRLDESLAERGVYQSGIRPQLYERDITTPFGRQYQDLATAAAQGYADASSQYGDAMLDYNRSMYNAYNDRANDAYELAPLSVPTGGYDLPHMPGPQLTTQIQGGGGGGRRGGGRTRRRGGRRRR